MNEAVATLDLIPKIVTLFSIVGGGGVIVWRMSRMATRFELIGTAQANEIAGLKEEMVEMRKLMTAVAVQKVLIEGQAERLNLLDRRYEELRHGEGYVFPLGTHLGKRE